MSGREPAAMTVPRRGRAVRRLWAALTVGYALLVLGYLGLRLLGALGLPVTDADSGLLAMLTAIGNSLMPGLLLPSLPLVVLAGLLRLPRAALALAPLGVAFALLYGPLFLPRPASAAPTAEPLVVYTHNLHVMSDGLAGVAEAIRASGADVVALQELSEPAAAYLGAALADLYPHQELHSVGLTTSGGGILSRWPLREAEVWRAAMLQLWGVVEWPGGDFAFYSLHPPPPRWFLQAFDASDRRLALDSALERAAQETLPVVLAGDFNLTDQTSDYAHITASGYRDAFGLAGWGLGLTFADFGGYFAPLSLLPPFIRIDYVFVSAHWQALEASAGGSALGSDHYPVRATLARTGAAP